MAASLTDKITDVRNAGRPNSATVITARAVAGTTLPCNSLTGWPTASKVHFVTYQIDTNSNPIAGTQLDCYGIVSGSTITQVTVLDGTDGGNTIGDIVEMLPTAAWAQDLVDALGVTLNRDGTLVSSIVTTAKINDLAVTTAKINDLGVTTGKINDLAVTTGKLADDAVTAAKLDGIDKSLLTTDSNPYKFSAYRAAAFTSGSPAVIAMDTEIFDTNSNFDITTNKGRYTVPITGFYQLNGCGALTQTAGNPGFQVSILKNGATTIAYGSSMLAFAGSWTYILPVAALVQLTAGDYVEVNLYGSAVAGAPGLALCYFNGFLVSRT